MVDFLIALGGLLGTYALGWFVLWLRFRERKPEYHGYWQDDYSSDPQNSNHYITAG